jgi:TolB-like protein
MLWLELGFVRQEDGDRLSPTSAPRLSIVVLPFANIGGDPEQDYFVDGVTESLTTDLSRISGAFVIARNTAFLYREMNPHLRPHLRFHEPSGSRHG